MKKYDHQKIEKKWVKAWDKAGIYNASDKSAKPKYYALVEFPYPSGVGLHVGHIRSNTAMDIVARKRRMEGYNVLYPMGWDAFGLPTENYAIKTGIAPQVATKKNTDTFRKQLKMMGFSFDWTREIDTTDPKYYKWTQWMFLQFFKHGLAYKDKAEINWCPKDKIGLANEEVENEKCERCGGPVEKRMKEQWMLKMSSYSEKLLSGLKGLDFIPEVTTQQQNWIGKSEGAEVEFPISPFPKGSTPEAGGISIRVFTTRIDTILGATFLVLAPEHPLAQMKDIKVINPATKQEIPVYVSDYVFAKYGTGAIMAVPQHDERDRAFAEKLNLPIVDKPLLPFDEALKLSGGVKKIQYKLRDWVFSRQRYWGEPIPLVHCEKCGWVPVPEDKLPVKLPKVEKYQPTDNGESPLSKIDKWVNVKCPNCKGPAKRETDTMPNWAGSSWYYMAYLLDKKTFDGPTSIENWKLEIENLGAWLPVDWYNGGMEHATRHLLYARFWNQFLYDIGEVPVSEPFKKRTAHGMILASDGKKMSKSLGNVINPEELVKEFGADALRMYEMFIGPFDQMVAWDPRGILGCSRFLERVWKIATTNLFSNSQEHENRKSQKLLHKTIKKVTEDIEKMSFNTAISAMMMFINEISNFKFSISNEDWGKFLKILAPFAPFMTEELWQQNFQNSKFKIQNSIHTSPWPEYDAKLLVEENFDLIIQVNGRVRTKVSAPRGISEEDAKKLALENADIKKWIAGEPKKIIFIENRLINLLTE